MNPHGVPIAVDFDGTLVHHRFPVIGEEVPGAFHWLKRWKKAGAKLILWTMRSDGQAAGDVLTEAIEYCREKGVEFDAVNEGIGDKEWTTSPKAYAKFYVDDAAVGCPLIFPNDGLRPFVDWSKVGPAIMRVLTGTL